MKNYASFWMKDAETASKEKIREIQWNKLESMLNYVETHSIFYKSKYLKDKVPLNKIKNLSDIQHLPFTTRDELVADQKNNGGLGTLMCSDFSMSGQTIGLTGVKISASNQPIKVIMSMADAYFQGKLAARGMTGVGITLADYLYIADFPQFNPLYMHMGLGSVNIGAKVLTVGMERTERNTSIFPAFYPPSAYCINPTYSNFVVEQLLKTEKKYPITTVFGWGESGYSIPAIRERFQKNWSKVSSSPKVKVFDVYGMVEMGLLGFECSQQNGVHAFEDGYLYEIIDPETEKILAPGQEGELVLTHLERSGMPLIRYRTGDIATIDDEPCPCGRTHLRLKGIKGRYDQRLIINGITIYPSQIEALLAEDKGLSEKYNILVDRSSVSGDLAIAMADEKVSLPQAQQLQERLSRKLNVPIKVNLVKEEDLVIFPHRSYKIIDSQNMHGYRAEAQNQYKTET